MVKECAVSTPGNTTSICGGGGGGGMASGLLQEEKGRPGGQVQNILIWGGGAYWPLCLVRKGHIGVCTPSLHTRDYLSVNNSLHFKTQILFC